MKPISSLFLLATLFLATPVAASENPYLLNLPIGFGDKTSEPVCTTKSFQADAGCQVFDAEGAKFTVFRGIGSREKIADFLAKNPAKGFEPIGDLFKSSNGKFFSVGPNSCAAVLVAEGCKCSDTGFGPKISCDGAIGDILGVDFPPVFGKRLPAATVFTVNPAVLKRNDSLFAAEKDFCGPPPKGCFCNIKGFFQCEDGSTKQIP